MKPSFINKLVIASLIWVTGAYLIHELCSLDIWWQLIIGEDILQQLRIPASNLYSAGALNQPYHDSHWLFQVALAISHRLAGLNGPILFMTLIWGAVFAITYREIRTDSSTAWAVLLCFLAVGASAERFLPRPEIITFLMIALFYSLLRQGKYESGRDLIILTLLQVLWVNSHGLFVIGPFMVGSYWLMEAIRYSTGKPNHFKQLSLLLVLISGALFASPYGSGALEYSYLLFSEVGQEAPDYMQRVNELSPTFGAKAMGASAFWFFLLLLVTTVISMLLNFRAINLARLLIICGLALAAITGRRNIVLFALVAAPFIGENLQPCLSRLNPKPWMQKAGASMLALGMLLWSSYALSGLYYIHMQIPARAGLGVTPDFFPHGLIEFIKQHDIKGQVYNTNRLGGFYLYHFFPDRLPLLDGRWEVYGDRFFEEKEQALQDYPSWKKWTAQYGVTNVLLHHTSHESPMLVPALYRDPDWSLVYYDFAASFFVRNDHLGSAQPITFSRHSQVLPDEPRPDSRYMLSSFYRNLGLKHLLAENLKKSLTFGYHRANTLTELAKVSMELGRYTEAEQHYRELLQLDDRQIDALSDLAFLNYQRRDYGQALHYSQRAVNVAPGNIDVLFNHALVLAANGERGAAISQLKAILQTQPNYQKAHQLLRQIEK
jgi:hypothetical protein